MTKSTFNTVWLAGGGLLATWLAVNPNTTIPVASNLPVSPRTAAVGEVTADNLNLQASKLREQAGKVPMRSSTRNPFRFRRAAAETPRASAALSTTVPAAPPQPSLALSGIATDGQTRTAIISGDGQVYLVKEGESVAGRYHVVTIESNAVTLGDASGREVRLVLH